MVVRTVEITVGSSHSIRKLQVQILHHKPCTEDGLIALPATAQSVSCNYNNSQVLGDTLTCQALP